MIKPVLLPLALLLYSVCAISQTTQRIAPGIWKIAFGPTDSFRPSEFKAPASVEGLSKLPAIDFPPFRINRLNFRNSGGDVVIDIPIDSSERLYNYNTTPYWLDDRGKRIDDPDLPFYISSNGYGLLVNTSRNTTFYLGHNRKVEDSIRHEINIQVHGAAGVELYVIAGPGMKEVVQRYVLFHGDGELPVFRSDTIARIPAYIHPDSPIFDSIQLYAGNYQYRSGVIPDLLTSGAQRILSEYYNEAYVTKGITSFGIESIDTSLPAITQFPSGADGAQMRHLFGLLQRRLLMGLYQQRISIDPVPVIDKRLEPYLYAAYARYYFEGIPPIRPLVIDYADDPRVFNTNNEYLIGDVILCATTGNIYLPAGNWYDVDTWQKYTGAQFYKLTDTSHLFVKENTILPLALTNDNKITCHIYGNPTQPALLFEDDNFNNDYRKGGFSLVSLSWNGHRIKLSRKGNYKVSNYSLSILKPFVRAPM